MSLKSEAQKLIEQAKETLETCRMEVGEWEQIHDALEALDQLSAHFEEQEKAVRLKVLEELRNDYENSYIKLGPMGLELIDQKIEEAKNERRILGFDANG